MSVIILMGVSGCGKTAVGRGLETKGWKFLDGDDFHSIENREKMKAGIALTDADREPWLLTLAELASGHSSNQNLAIACSALKKSYRRILRENGDPSILFVHLDVSKAIAKERLEKRQGHFFNPRLLNNQFETLETLDPATENFCLIDAQLSIDAIISSIINYLSDKHSK